MSDEHSDLEIATLLGFAQAWFDAGVIDIEQLQQIIEAFRNSDDDNPEHYRYGAFIRYLKSRPVLSERDFNDLFALGRSDPDEMMGCAMIFELMTRSECPESLFTRAAAIPTLQVNAEELRHRHHFDNDFSGYRDRLRGLGPNRYLAEYGTKRNGRPRTNDRLFYEMGLLFGMTPT